MKAVHCTLVGWSDGAERTISVGMIVDDVPEWVKTPLLKTVLVAEDDFVRLRDRAALGVSDEPV